MSNSALFSAGSSGFSPSGVQPPTGDSRFIPVGGSVSGLNVTFGKNEKFIYEFMTSHLDSFLEILSGTDTDIQINNGPKTTASVRIVSPSGQINTYPCGQYYSHGCFNILEILTGADETDVTVYMNGHNLGTANIGITPLNIDNIGTAARFIKKLQYIQDYFHTTFLYDFLEESGVTAGPTEGSGSLTFGSEPRRFEFTLADGLWVALPSGYPDPVKITIPEAAAKYHSFPVSVPSNISFLWGYGQSLGRNFLNGTANEQRHHSTTKDAYMYYSGEISKYAPRKDKAAVGWIELNTLVSRLGESFLYHNSAQASASIATLSKGQATYDGYFDETGILSLTAPLLTNTVVDHFYATFTHGEADTSEENTKAYYKSAVIQLKEDIKADARAFLGNNAIPVSLVYTQVGRVPSFRDISQAFYELSSEEEFIYAGPRWHLNKYYSDKLDTPPDGVHLSPYGYALLAEIHAEAIIQGSAWNPLLTVEAESDIDNNSQEVTVLCSVQTEPLRKYEDIVDDQLGIYYVNPGGTEFPISTATLNSNSITVNLGRQAEEGGFIRFGSTARNTALPPINIKDSTEWIGSDTTFTHSHVMPIHDIAITQVNIKPIADAGPSQSGIEAGEIVTLNGLSSYDPDNTGPISYLWEQTEGDPVVLDSYVIGNPQFTAPTKAYAQTITFSLVVNDTLKDSEPNTINISVLKEGEFNLTGEIVIGLISKIE